MDKVDSDFMVLQELADRIENDYDNAGWYMHRAYLLGQGYSVTDCLEFPPKDKSAVAFRVIEGGKK